jgi:hypothetical protein
MAPPIIEPGFSVASGTDSILGMALPAGLAGGDLLILAVGGRNAFNAAATATAGGHSFTLLFQQNHGPGSTQCCMTYFGLSKASYDASPIDINMATSAKPQLAICYRITGVPQDDALSMITDIKGNANDDIAAMSVDVTIADADSLTLASYNHRNNTEFTVTAPEVIVASGNIGGSGGSAITNSSCKTENQAIGAFTTNATNPKAKDWAGICAVISPGGGQTLFPDIDVNPTSWDFGTIESGTQSPTKDFIIDNLGDADLTITDISLTGGDVSEFTITAGGGAQTVTPAGSHTVTCRFDPATAAAKSTTLQILSDSPGEETVNIPLSGIGGATATPDIDVTPLTHNFGNTASGSLSATQDFTVQNLGGATLNISNIALGGTDFDQFTITAGGGPQTILPAGSHTVTARHSPLEVAAHTAFIVINSDDPDEDPVNVTLNGNGIAPPAADISIDPISFNFGNVGFGSSPTTVFTVTNNGALDLEITSSNVSGTDAADFAVIVGGGPQTVIPAGTHEITVQFTSAAPTGLREAQLDIVSNDPDTPTLVAPLQGTPILSPVQGDGTIDGSTEHSNKPNKSCIVFAQGKWWAMARHVSFPSSHYLFRKEDNNTWTRLQTNPGNLRDQSTTQYDMVTDGTKIYLALGRMNGTAQFVRLAYNSGTDDWTAEINQTISFSASEDHWSLIRDTGGTLYLFGRNGDHIDLQSSQDDGTTWQPGITRVTATPPPFTGAGNLDSDQFDTDKVGVACSKNAGTGNDLFMMYVSLAADETVQTNWTLEDMPTIPNGQAADDHIAVRTDPGTDQLLICVKDGNDVITLYQRTGANTYTLHTVPIRGDRPAMVIDDENNALYIVTSGDTAPPGEAAVVIQANLSDYVFGLP